MAYSVRNIEVPTGVVPYPVSPAMQSPRGDAASGITAGIGAVGEGLAKAADTLHQMDMFNKKSELSRQIKTLMETETLKASQAPTEEETNAIFTAAKEKAQTISSEFIGPKNETNQFRTEINNIILPHVTQIASHNFNRKQQKAVYNIFEGIENESERALNNQISIPTFQNNVSRMVSDGVAAGALTGSQAFSVQKNAVSAAATSRLREFSEKNPGLSMSELQAKAEKLISAAASANPLAGGEGQIGANVSMDIQELHVGARDASDLMDSLKFDLALLRNPERFIDPIAAERAIASINAKSDRYRKGTEINDFSSMVNGNTNLVASGDLSLSASIKQTKEAKLPYLEKTLGPVAVSQEIDSAVKTQVRAWFGDIVKRTKLGKDNPHYLTVKAARGMLTSAMEGGISDVLTGKEVNSMMGGVMWDKYETLLTVEANQQRLTDSVLKNKQKHISNAFSHQLLALERAYELGITVEDNVGLGQFGIRSEKALIELSTEINKAFKNGAINYDQMNTLFGNVTKLAVKIEGANDRQRRVSHLLQLSNGPGGLNFSLNSQQKADVDFVIASGGFVGPDGEKSLKERVDALVPIASSLRWAPQKLISDLEHAIMTADDENNADAEFALATINLLKQSGPIAGQLEVFQEYVNRFNEVEQRAPNHEQKWTFIKGQTKQNIFGDEEKPLSAVSPPDDSSKDKEVAADLNAIRDVIQSQDELNKPGLWAAMSRILPFIPSDPPLPNVMRAGIGYFTDTTPHIRHEEVYDEMRDTDSTFFKDLYGTFLKLKHGQAIFDPDDPNQRRSLANTAFIEVMKRWSVDPKTGRLNLYNPSSLNFSGATQEWPGPSNAPVSISGSEIRDAAGGKRVAEIFLNSQEKMDILADTDPDAHDAMVMYSLIDALQKSGDIENGMIDRAHLQNKLSITIPYPFGGGDILLGVKGALLPTGIQDEVPGASWRNRWSSRTPGMFLGKFLHQVGEQQMVPVNEVLEKIYAVLAGRITYQPSVDAPNYAAMREEVHPQALSVLGFTHNNAGELIVNPNGPLQHLTRHVQDQLLLSFKGDLVHSYRSVPLNMSMKIKGGPKQGMYMRLGTVNPDPMDHFSYTEYTDRQMSSFIDKWGHYIFDNAHNYSKKDLHSIIQLADYDGLMEETQNQIDVLMGNKNISKDTRKEQLRTLKDIQRIATGLNESRGRNHRGFIGHREEISMKKNLAYDLFYNPLDWVMGNMGDFNDMTVNEKGIEWPLNRDSPPTEGELRKIRQDDVISQNIGTPPKNISPSEVFSTFEEKGW